MRPSQSIKLCLPALFALFLSACYSEYKIVPPTQTGYGGIGVQSSVDATAIFPLIPKDYRVQLKLNNNTAQNVCLSHVVVSLKRHGRKNERLLSALKGDSVQLKPGENSLLSFDFKRHSPLFFPHKITLDVTASLRDSSSQKTIMQGQQFVRYMYVNIGGD